MRPTASETFGRLAATLETLVVPNVTDAYARVRTAEMVGVLRYWERTIDGYHLRLATECAELAELLAGAAEVAEWSGVASITAPPPGSSLGDLEAAAAKLSAAASNLLEALDDRPGEAPDVHAAMLGYMRHSLARNPTLPMTTHTARL